MFNVRLLRELYLHMEWADARVWQAVLTLDAAHADDRTRTLLHHLHETQRAFLCVWTDRPLAWPASRDFAALREARSWARPYYGEVGRLLERLDDAQLARPLSVPWAAQLESYLDRPAAKVSLGESMFQVTSHSTYHRAQVNTRLRELEGDPPLVDYIAWLWLGRPAATWELEDEP